MTAAATRVMCFAWLAFYYLATVTLRWWTHADWERVTRYFAWFAIWFLAASFAPHLGG